MPKTFALIFVLAGLLSACAGPGPWVNGNDTGGIIPWSPANEAAAFAMSDAHCARYYKQARVTSVYAQPGNYIGFACAFPRGYILREDERIVRTRG
jgi:hypothetical protein